MNNVTRENAGFLVLECDWADGSMQPIAAAATQEEAEQIMRDQRLCDPDAVLYAVAITAFAR